MIRAVHRLMRHFAGRPGQHAIEKRSFSRFPVEIEVKIHAQGRVIAGIIRDVSAAGILVTASEPAPPVGEPVKVERDGLDTIAGAVIRHFPGGFAVRFDITEDSVNYALAALSRHRA